MIYLRIFLEMFVIAIFIFYVSGRLIGNRIHVLKRLFSVIFGVGLTTLVYWYSYLRFTDYFNEGFLSAMTDASTVIWIGSMLMISMLFFLFLELFDTQTFATRRQKSAHKSIFLRLRHNFRRQKRLSHVLEIAMKNGISTTIHYARHRENDRDLAIALRRTLEQSGGIFIKFGQALSTRADLLHPAFIEELGKLQQNVEPLSREQVQLVLSKSLPGSFEEAFSSFNIEPLAAGSIGQVHRAVLRKNGAEVVVKLLRPDITTIMRDDLDILVQFAEWVTEKSTWAASIGFRQLAIGFANGLREEIDFDIEIRNTIQIANILEKSPYEVKVPRVYREYSNKNLIVLEFFQGKSVSKGPEIFEQFGVDPKEFAKTVLFSLLEQMLFSGIFHADPHPGNVFIDGQDGVPVLLDFGAVGRLAQPQQEALAQFVIGVQQNDSEMIYDAITSLIEETKDIDRPKMQQAIGQILLKVSYVDRIPTDELIHALFDVVRDFGLSFYPAVGTALRSLITLDGTLRTIDPTFDMFTDAKQFAKKFKRDSLTRPFREPRATKERLEEEVALLLPELKKIPRRVEHLVRRIEGGRVVLHHDIFSDKANARYVTLLFSRFILLMTGITFGIISSALLAIAQFIDTVYAVYLNIAAYTGLFLCVILLVRLAIQAVRDIKDGDLS